MAEAFLQVVLENLSSLIKEEIGVIMGVDEEMKKLSSTLTTIQSVLEDAELNQVESKPIQDWLRKVNALAYEIDDILDECNTHVSKLNHSAGGKLSRYSLQKVLYRRKIGRRMKKVTEKLDSVAAERAKFHLREVTVDRPREVAAAAASRETGSLLNEPDTIYARDEDRDMIVKLLVEDAVDKQEVSVLPIIGIGGLGKTTLAQLVFNDPRAVDHFEKRIWVCVSDDFDIKTLVKAMIESATGSAKDSELQSLDALERRLRELLSQKRYLLVLDDVWNDSQHKWFELKSILSCGSTGSSIIVTTRQKKVADIMRTLPSHCLQGLSEEHCWMLLKQRAFGRHEEEEEEKYPELVRIGKQIVKKCAGVPLAAKALGGILRFKRKEEDWIYVRESEIWKLSAEDSLIMPALRLSYHHLPLELRQCFAYFAAFPKDYQIKKERLITLWMAHGFISSRGTLQAEEVGNKICYELLLRSLFQGAFITDNIGMHDLVHDLAESIMDKKVPGMPIDINVPSGSTVREVNLSHRYVMFPKTFQQDIDISSVMELTSLRVLDASETIIKELPPSIANLKHLRYLNLSSSEIRTLPNSLCSLWNLQVLNLDYCTSLVALPNNMRYLRNLQHLCLAYCQLLSEMPSKMRELTHLKTLSTFVVGFNRSNQLEELQCLNLSGRLELRHLERVKHHLDAKKANLTEKKGLQELWLSWERNNTISKKDEEVDEKVLEALEPPSNLEVLVIVGFRGRCFPFWMTNSTLGKVVWISIMNCENCTRLPKLGDLPHLKTLVLRNVGVEYVIEEVEVESGKLVNTQFLALESLSLLNLPNLRGLSKEQEIKESFPNLRQLQIQDCPSLVLPPLSSLKKLEDLECSSSTLPLFSEVITLDSLEVKIDEKMAAFPLQTLVRFTNLRQLTIEDANEISVPVQGLQTLQKLAHLTIYRCNTMRCMPEGLLRHLTALTELSIDWCPELVELPEEIKHLHNLESITLGYLPKMACLPEALQHLSSLRKLALEGLDELESLPDCLHQLTHLWVERCPKLVSLPHAILHNLKYLTVKGCPELERRCKRGSGDYWHIIARIPLLRIHD